MVDDPAGGADSTPAASQDTPPRSSDAMPRWLPRAFAMFFGGIVVLLTAWWLLQKLRGLLVMLLVALFLSFALEPAVNFLQRKGWRRGIATGVVLLGLVLLVAAFGAAMGSVLAAQIGDFVDDAPGYIEDIETWVNDTFDADVDADDLVREFQEGGAAADFASDIAGNLVAVGTTVLSVLFQILTIGLFTFYLVADGPRLRRAILSTLRPGRQREVLRVWEIAIDKTGGYIYSRGLLALVSTLFHWAAFEVIGIPFPLPLALWVGIFSQFVPVIGTYIAGALPVLIALLDDPVTALWTLAVIVVYQQVENYLLHPRITAQTMEIHPAVAFGTVIAGASILGPIGALLALPAAATGQAFVSTYVNRHDVIEAELTDHRTRAERAADEAAGVDRFRRTDPDDRHGPRWRMLFRRRTTTN